MKRKAGQAPSPSRSSAVRNTSLVPVENSDSTKLEVSDSEAPKALATKTPDEIFDISVEKNEESIAEAPVKSLAVASAAKSASDKSTSSKSSSSKSSSSKSSSSKSSSSSSKSGVRTAKAKGKGKKKRRSLVPLLTVIFILELLGLGTHYYLYRIGYFKPTIMVTMADGSEQKIKVEDAYAEINIDKFYQGTKIDGIEVGGMTLDEAYAAVSASLPEEPEDVAVKLNVEGKLFPVDFTDVTFEYNAKEVVDEAYKLYRPTSDDPDELAACYNAIQQLKVTPVEYETAYSVHIDGIAEKVHEVLDPLLDQFATTKDASIEEFDPETKEFTITKEQTGYVLDVDGAIQGVKDLFDKKKYSGMVKVPTVLKEPEVTEELLREQFGLVSEFSTKCSSNTNRNNNISQACKYISGTILQPGEQFSFNKVVGVRTYERGFREATVILGGQYEQGLGGGICQVSSTLYNAVAKADLKVVERNNHAWPSDYVLTGCDATVDYPALDFKFENNTDFQVIVVMWFKDNTVYAEIYGKKLPDGQYIKLESNIISTTSAGPNEYVEDKTMPAGQQKTLRAAHQGQTARIYKVWFDKDDKEIKREEYYTTSYKAFGTRIAVGTLNGDGTYAVLDTKTGEVTAASATPTPTANPTAATTDTPTTTAAPQDTTTPAITSEPENPPSDDPGSGGSGGSGEENNNNTDNQNGG